MYDPLCYICIVSLLTRTKFNTHWSTGIRIREVGCVSIRRLEYWRFINFDWGGYNLRCNASWGCSAFQTAVSLLGSCLCSDQHYCQDAHTHQHIGRGGIYGCCRGLLLLWKHPPVCKGTLVVITITVDHVPSKCHYESSILKYEMVKLFL